MVPIEAFRFDPAASVTEIAVGAAPLLVIDGVFADPEMARSTARLLPAPLPHLSDFYPGLRFPVPDDFHQAFVDWLNGLSATSSLLAGKQAVSERNAYVSVVTKPAFELLPIQTIPHFDTTDDQVFAAVIYLFETGFGGTSFYRHRSTGLQCLTPQAEPLYRAALRREVADPSAVPRRYRNGGDALFQRIHRQEPRFNRMILYPGRALHAGDIDPDFAGAAGLVDGRLTIAALCRLIPR